MIFSIYYHQAADLIECKINKSLPPKLKKKPPQNVCSIFFENRGVEFMNIACILFDLDIVKSLPSSSVKFSMPMLTYKLIPPTSTKFFNFNTSFNNLDLDLFLTNPDSVPSKSNNSPFADTHHKHIVTGDPLVIRNNVSRRSYYRTYI